MYEDQDGYDSSYKFGARIQSIDSNDGHGGSSSINISSQNDDVYKNSLRSVTIRQILGATQVHYSAPFEIDGKEVENVTVVANVVSWDAQPMFNAFHLEDGSRGRLLGRQWREGDVLPLIDFTEQTYVHLVGNISRFNERNYLTIRCLRKIEDMHEVYYHILKTIVDTLTYERGPPSSQYKYCGGTPIRSHHVDNSNVTATPTSYPPTSEATSEVVQLSNPSVTRPKGGYLKAVQNISLTEQPNKATNFESITMGSIILDRDKSTKKTAPSVVESQFQPENSTFRVGQAQTRLRSSSFIHKPRPSLKTTYVKSPADLATFPLPTVIQNPIRGNPSKRRDPYSDLSPLQRDIILCIHRAGPTDSVYPQIGERRNEWEGLHIKTIVLSIDRVARGDADIEEFEHAIDELIEQGYVYTTVDDSHFKVTEIS